MHFYHVPFLSEEFCLVPDCISLRILLTISAYPAIIEVKPATDKTYERGKQNMNRKILEIYRQLAQSAGLSMDEASGTVHGLYGSYQVLITPAVSGSNTYYFMPVISIAAASPSHTLSKEEAKDYKREHKNVSLLKEDNRLITLSLKNCRKADRLISTVNEELQSLTFWLRQNGYENCCQMCGKPGDTAAFYVSGFYTNICPDCAQTVSQNAVIARQQEHVKTESLIGGIVGALLGTLIGVLSIILLSQLGYVAALSGVLMAVCTLKGYELLGKKLSTKGIVICCILMILMTYVGDRLDWAIVIARELAVDFGTAYQSVPYLLQIGVLDSAAYWGNLLLVYLFVLLGAVPTIMNIMKNKKNQDKIFRSH